MFTMQAGPGAENAFSGVATAYSDSVPVLCLPVGHPRGSSQVFHFFRSAQAYAPISKWVEEITVADQVPEILRRAFTYSKLGRPGPVMVEIPGDIAVEEFSGALNYTPVKRTTSGANARDVAEAAKVLVASENSHDHRRARRVVGRGDRRIDRACRAARSFPCRHRWKARAPFRSTIRFRWAPAPA